MESYVIRGGQEGFDRLQVLARSWRPTTLALLERAGVGPGMHCLDLGCGAGDVTLDMARLVGPDGRVVGVDMDEVKLELAAREAERAGVSTIEWRHLNVYDWAEGDSYDLVYSRNVLQHVSRPVDVLRSMWAGLRSGGVIVVEDADFEGSFTWPPNDGYDFWVDKYQQVLVNHGGDPLSGRKLLARFVEAGIPAPALSVVQRADSVGEGKTMPYLTIQATADAIIGEGVATAAEVETALASLAEHTADPHSVLGSPRLFQAWSRHP